MPIEFADNPTPGNRIRTARKARNLSLEDLATETRIPLRLLSAIEMDDYDQLSGPLYAKSFLRNCAAALDLDTITLLEDFEQLLTEKSPELPAEQTWEMVAEVRRVSGLPWRNILIGLVAVAAVGLGIWYFMARSDEGPAEVADADAGAITASADSAATTAPEPWSDADPDDPASGEERVVTPAQETLDALTTLPVGDPDLIFAGGETWPLVLRVVVESRMEFAVGFDGDRVPLSVAWPDRPAVGVPQEGITPGRLHAVGSRYVAYWGAADHFVLRLPDAEGVAVSLNGRVLPIPLNSVGRDWVLDAATLGR